MTQYIPWLRGCGTALVTPFTATGAVDEKRFRALVERQIAAGVRLLVPCGTTGEARTMPAPHHDRLAGFRVLSGDDAVTLPLIALGADGIVSVVSNETPDLMANLTESALRGEWETARELHYRLLPLMEANFLESNPGPVKAALAAMGLLEEHFRLPLVPVQEQTRARVRAVLGALGRLPGAAHVAA